LINRFEKIQIHWILGGLKHVGGNLVGFISFVEPFAVAFFNKVFCLAHWLHYLSGKIV